MTDYYGNQPDYYGEQPKQNVPSAPVYYGTNEQQPIVYEQQIKQNTYAVKEDVTSPLTQNQKFKASKTYNDKFWGIVFYLQLILMIVLSIYYFAKHSSGYKHDNSGFVNKHFWALCSIVAVTSIISSIFWLGIIRKYARCMIWFCLIVGVGLWALMGIVAIAAGNVVLAVICIIIALLQSLWIYCVRHRIAFAAAVLELAIEACNEFSSVYSVSILSVFVQCAWLIIWTMGVAFATYNSNVSGGILFFFVLSFYWTTQVIANVVHVTCSGVVATWYFLFPSSTPEHPVRDSFDRSMTTSFGSICFGSFLVAVIQTIKYMVQTMKTSKNQILQCIVVCILGCLERLLNYFNFYAFTRVAIYGLPYIQAAKETYQLFKSKGFDIIINDDLINPVLMISCFISGLISALLTTFACLIFMSNVNWALWVLIAFVVAFALTLCVLVVIRSGVATIFVCFAEDPAALSLKPEPYSKLTTAWRERHGSLPNRLTNPN